MSARRGGAAPSGLRSAGSEATGATREDGASSAAPALARGALKQRLKFLPAGLKASAALVVVGVLLGFLVDGAAGAGGAVLGVALVAASFTVSSLVIAWADSVNPTLVFPVGMLTYILKITAIGFGCYALASTGWAGLPAFGVATMVATVGWATAQAWWTWHAKILYVDV